VGPPGEVFGCRGVDDPAKTPIREHVANIATATKKPPAFRQRRAIKNSIHGANIRRALETLYPIGYNALPRKALRAVAALNAPGVAKTGRKL